MATTAASQNATVTDDAGLFFLAPSGLCSGDEVIPDEDSPSPFTAAGGANRCEASLCLGWVLSDSGPEDDHVFDRHQSGVCAGCSRLHTPFRAGRDGKPDAHDSKDDTSEHDDKDEGDLAKKVQNPVADPISVPFQNNTSYNIGTNERASNTLNIQPVIPVHLGDKLLLISAHHHADQLPAQSRQHGWRVVRIWRHQPDVLLLARQPGEVDLGVGPAFVLPTATQRSVGTGKWSSRSGGSGTAAAGSVDHRHPGQPGLVVCGPLRPIEGQPDDHSVLRQLQPGACLVPDHLPILTFNWEAASSNEWLVPFGGGFGKIFKAGKLPLNGSLQAFYNVHSSDSDDPGPLAGPPANHVSVPDGQHQGQEGRERQIGRREPPLDRAVRTRSRRHSTPGPCRCGRSQR